MWDCLVLGLEGKLVDHCPYYFVLSFCIGRLHRLRAATEAPSWRHCSFLASMTYGCLVNLKLGKARTVMIYQVLSIVWCGFGGVTH